MEEVPCDEMKQVRSWGIRERYNFELHIFYLLKTNFGQNMYILLLP